MLQITLAAITLPLTDPVLKFLLILVIILAAPLLLNKLRIPHLLGLIIAGAIIGPNGFNLVLRDSSIILSGTAGLLYIMFLAGLEIDLGDFKKNKWKSLTFGMYTFLVPMALGTLVGLYVLNFSMLTSILLASMFASHTLVTYPIVSKYGITKNRAVNVTIGGTVVTCLLALLVLAVIVGMSTGELTQGFWIQLGVSTLVFAFIVLWGFPFVGRWYFKRYDDRVGQFIFVLGLVFFASFLAEAAGLEAIIGAFLAGLALNRLIPNTSALMNRIEFVGNALFIPFFLIGVGMLVNFHVFLYDLTTIWVAVVMCVVATVSKFIPAWLAQKNFRFTTSERTLIFGLSNAQAAATLAAVLVGYNVILGTTPEGEPIRLLNESVLNGTVVMILFTCVISSLVTERSARRFALNEDAQPEDKGAKKAMEQILIPVANPETIENLVNLALVIKDAKQKNGMIALNVINDNNSSENKELQGKRNLEKAAMIAAAADVPVTMVSRYDLNIASGIIHTIKEYEATDVVIGLHRKANIVDSFFGNLAESLLKGTHREVMIAKFLMPVNTLRRIIIAVPPKAEFETGFSKWVEHFCRMGSILGCRVHFFANERTLMRLQQLVKKKFSGTPTEFSMLEEWGDLLLLTGQVNYDHLFVVISARRGSISYDPSFERLPAQLSKYFSNNSLIILYPDQFGDPQEIVSFSDPRGYNESQHYEKVGKWFYKWFKKS